MIDKEKAKLNPKKQWAKFIAVLALYLLFLLWADLTVMESSMV